MKTKTAAWLSTLLASHTLAYLVDHKILNNLKRFEVERDHTNTHVKVQGAHEDNNGWATTPNRPQQYHRYHSQPTKAGNAPLSNDIITSGSLSHDIDAKDPSKAVCYGCSPSYNFEWDSQLEDSENNEEQVTSKYSGKPKTRGTYSVQLPDGRIQSVAYVTNSEDGFSTDVSYSQESVPHDKLLMPSFSSADSESSSFEKGHYSDDLKHFGHKSDELKNFDEGTTNTDINNIGSLSSEIEAYSSTDRVCCSCSSSYSFEWDGQHEDIKNYEKE